MTNMTQVSGLSLTNESRNVSIDLRGNTSESWSEFNPVMAKRISYSRIPTATNIALTETIDGATVLSVSHSVVTNTVAFDAYRREMVRTDGRGNATTNAYDTLGRLASVTDPLGATTSYSYDAVGNIIAVTNALGNATIYEYDLRGNKTYEGGATYPVRYTYDDFNVMTNMTTYRNESLQSGDTTIWLYDEPTGLLTNKVYADGKGPTYTYTIDGKLATRTWARGIATGYSYDNWNNLTNTVYSDGTPTISLFYDVLGRQIKANDAAGVTTFLYDAFGSLTNETVIGVAGTNTIIRHWDNYGRTTGYSLVGRVVPSEPQRQSTIAYDPVTGRLLTMLANGSDTPFTWNYLDGSDLKSSLAYPNGLTASWTYDANNQLLQVCNAFPTNVISQYNYTYDATGRRVTCAKSGSAFTQDDTVAYGYNNRSELTNAVAAVNSDYRYAYDFDDIGNREASSERGTNSLYYANNLNQYTAIDDFTPQFDDDGNQTLIKTATGIWQVQYNGENRPIFWTNGATNIVMKFDRMGRRVEYIEAVGNATNTHHRFVYDGYLCIQRLDAAANNAIDLIFAWDPAESVATRPLMIEKHGKCMLYVTHDGNKNVSDLLFFNGGSGVAAHYEYAPFGALTASTRNSTSTAYDFRTYNPFRFSSEYADDALGLVYYNYRHYEPVMGRWLQRDRCVLTPLNPYLFLVNRASGIDCLGKYDEWVHYYLMYLLMREYGYDESAAKTMAEGSQYPDGESLWASLFLVQFDAMYIPNLITFQTKYQETLHNLNGLWVGKLEKYQCCIREAINSITKGENLKEMDYFKVGALVHALGDTYAHFKLVKGSDGKSYGPMIGHFEDGKKPDDPHNNIERFRKYLQELERLIPHNQNYRLDDHIYGYMSNRAWIYWDKDGYYSPPKVLSYKEQIKLLYGEKRLRFETMTVERTDQRDGVVKELFVQIKECLERARGK